MSKFAIFNMTDGIPSGGGQEFDSIDDAEVWISKERKKFMDIQVNFCRLKKNFLK